MACWSNPGVRAKLIAKQQAAPATEQTKGNGAKFPNVDSTPGVKAKAKSRSMEDTINEVVAKHYSH
jgi:hypothetical protein